MPVRWRAFTRGTALKSAAMIASVATAQRVHAEKQVKVIKQYPGPKVPTTYERSGHLEKAWVVSGPRINASGIITSIYNTMFYSNWVHGNEQGEDQQEQHEETGWKLAADYLEREVYRDSIQKAITNALH